MISFKLIFSSKNHHFITLTKIDILANANMKKKSYVFKSTILSIIDKGLMYNMIEINKIIEIKSNKILFILKGN